LGIRTTTGASAVEHLSTTWADLTKQGNTRLSLKGGLKEKDLIGIPWRVAFALQADGWYLRSDLIWAKGVSFCPTYSGSCMPESVQDRPTKGHEYVFLWAKSKRYYYDGDAVREQGEPDSAKRYQSDFWVGDKDVVGNGRPGGARNTPGIKPYTGTRNLRTVWTINPGSYAGAHFATFPPALVEPMIKAGTSAKGCCPECGAPWRRVTERIKLSEIAVGLDNELPKKRARQKMGLASSTSGLSASNSHNASTPQSPQVTTTGWTPTCSHYDGRYRADFPQAKSARKRWQRQMSGDWWRRVRKRPGLPGWPVEPCTVLDPFTGSGTTIEVAIRLRRRGIGIELSKPYCDEHIIPRLEAPIQMVLV
jgi:hypothetical protein